MFESMSPTRSEKTQKAYEVRYAGLRHRYAKAVGCDDADPNEVVALLILDKENYSMSSWRQVKAAVLHHIEIHAPRYDMAADRLRMESSAGLPRTSRKTSGGKQKKVPPEIWDEIQAELAYRHQQGFLNAERLLNFLKATLATGLRPNEWAKAGLATHIRSRRPVLSVGNSKHTNGRANGEYRDMFIDELQPVERRAIEATLTACAVGEDEATRVVQAMRDELIEVRKTYRVTRMSRRMTNTKICLYSFRHQFIADAKQAFDDPRMISALVGHASTKTAFTHYGARRNGCNAVRVSPTPESVEAVKLPRMERGHNAGLFGNDGPLPG